MWCMSGIEARIFIAVVAVAAAGVIDCTNLYASRASLRREGHTKVYAGDQKRLCDRTHV
jgi:hypothetical protein